MKVKLKLQICKSNTYCKLHSEDGESCYALTALLKASTGGYSSIILFEKLLEGRGQKLKTSISCACQPALKCADHPADTSKEVKTYEFASVLAAQKLDFCPIVSSQIVISQNFLVK